MFRSRHLQSQPSRPLLPLTDDQIVDLGIRIYGKGYWLVNDPSRYITMDLVSLGVDKEYLGAQGYDHFVYWPDYVVAGRISEIVKRFQEAGVTHVHISELHRISDGKMGSFQQKVPLTEEIIWRNSLDPLNPVHQKFILDLSKKNSQGKRVALIPYSFYEGKLVFLLGKNPREVHWRSSGYWSDFGGAPESGESVYQTAAREGFEESMGILGSYDEILERISGTSVYEYGNSIYIPYEVDYDESSYWPEIYKRVYKYMSSCFQETFLGTQTAPCCPEGYFEKTEIEWFQIDYLQQNKHLFLPQLLRGIGTLDRRGIFVQRIF